MKHIAFIVDCRSRMKRSWASILPGLEKFVEKMSFEDCRFQFIPVRHEPGSFRVPRGSFSPKRKLGSFIETVRRLEIPPSRDFAEIFGRQFADVLKRSTPKDSAIIVVTTDPLDRILGDQLSGEFHDIPVFFFAATESYERDGIFEAHPEKPSDAYLEDFSRIDHVLSRLWWSKIRDRPFDSEPLPKRHPRKKRSGFYSALAKLLVFIGVVVAILWLVTPRLISILERRAEPVETIIRDSRASAEPSGQTRPHETKDFLEIVDVEAARPRLTFANKASFAKVVNLRPLSKSLERPLKFRDVLDLYGTRDLQEDYVLFGLLKLHNRLVVPSDAVLADEINSEKMVLLDPQTLNIGRIDDASLTPPEPGPPTQSLQTLSRSQSVDFSVPDRIVNKDKSTRGFEIKTEVVNTSDQEFELVIKMGEVLTPAKGTLREVAYQSLSIVEIYVGGEKLELSEGQVWRIPVDPGEKIDVKAFALCMNEGADEPGEVDPTRLFVDMDFSEVGANQQLFWGRLEKTYLEPIITDVQRSGRGPTELAAIADALSQVVITQFPAIGETHSVLKKRYRLMVEYTGGKAEGSGFLKISRHGTVGDDLIRLNFRVQDVKAAGTDIEVLLLVDLDGYPLLKLHT